MLAIVAIAGISIIQVYWFRQAFNAESDQFNREITTALHSVANRFFELNKAAIPASNPIERMSSGYYVVMINNEIDANLLENLLIEEFAKRDVELDFEYGIYDCTDDEMVYGNYVSISNTEESPSRELPKWEDQAYYFGVNFPERSQEVLSRLDVWIFSSIVLLVVIVFFAYSLVVILKQKRLSEIQKDFINTMTHEFKTPISTIAISANVLKDPGIVQQPERLLNYATIIDNENSRMEKQVERVLQIATMDRSDLHLKKEAVDVNKLINEICEGLKLASEKEIDIRFSLAEIPEITVDKLHFSNVLYNLLDNAVKYSSGKADIKISTSSSDQVLMISVQDKGIGIESAQLKKIFNKFYRVPTGNVHDASGFGLGLSYVSLIIESHQGTIDVESEPGVGSTFTIKMPVS